MDFLRKYELVFWDFDGVIKDSVDVKGQAFFELFQPFGDDIAKRVQDHHAANGGMSRFEKIPIYLRWASEDSCSTQIDSYCDMFSQLVLQRVIDSPWVSGVETFLHCNPYSQVFVLVSATPLGELKQILKGLQIEVCFEEIFGAPTSKSDALSMVIVSRGLDPKACLMIGDAREDLAAARANSVDFLLRLHPNNSELFANYNGPFVRNFV